MSEGRLTKEGDDDLEDREILKLYFERNELAIAKTAEKYGGYTC